METMAKVDLSWRDLEMLLVATFESIGRDRETIRKNADWPELCRDCRKTISEKETLLKALQQARDSISPAFPA